MYELKITIDQLKNYLGTRLKCEHPTTKGHYWKLSHDETVLNTISIKVALEIEAKPICYLFSDLDKHIPELGFVPIEEILKIATKQIWGEPIDPVGECEILTEGESTGIIAWNDTERVSFTVDKNERRFDFTLYMDGSEMMLNKWDLFQKLFQWHFWPFGDEYFEKGLVIDKLKKDE